MPNTHDFTSKASLRPSFLDDRINSKKASEMIGRNPNSLEQTRHNGTHPPDLPYYKLGRRVWYRRSDVELYIEKHRVCPAAKSGSDEDDEVGWDDDMDNPQGGEVNAGLVTAYDSTGAPT